MPGAALARRAVPRDEGPQGEGATERRWTWFAVVVVAGGLAGTAAGRAAEDIRRPLASPLKILLKAIADCGMRIAD